MTRVYLPVAADQLAALVADGSLPGPLRAYAVTEGLRREWPADLVVDTDDLEYAALMAAADAARVLAEATDGRRRVLAADADAAPDPDGGHPAAVVVAAGLDRARVASAHIDLEPVEDPDEDLAWFAPEEIPGLV